MPDIIAPGQCFRESFSPCDHDNHWPGDTVSPRMATENDISALVWLHGLYVLELYSGHTAETLDCVKRGFRNSLKSRISGDRFYVSVIEKDGHVIGFLLAETVHIPDAYDGIFTISMLEQTYMKFGERKIANTLKLFTYYKNWCICNDIKKVQTLALRGNERAMSHFGFEPESTLMKLDL